MAFDYFQLASGSRDLVCAHMYYLELLSDQGQYFDSVTGTCLAFDASGSTDSKAGLGTAALLYNAVLNVYATAFLITALLRYRTVHVKCFGKKASTSHHLHLTSILLESAAINVPVVIASAIGMGLNQEFGTIIFIAVVPSQVCHSFLEKSH